MKFVILATLIALCGASQRPFPDGRIVGGYNIEIEDAPHQVSMEYYGSHRCGGSVLAANIILTAAHCTAGTTAGNMKIRAGTTNKGSGGQLVQVNRIIQHEKYDSSRIDYDLSILFLAQNLNLGSKIRAIGLPGNTEIGPGRMTVVTGWGALREGGSSPTILQAVDLPIVDRVECAKVNGITARMICAGVPAGGKDSCQGDSGGPMAANGILHGVVSWGYGCARPGYPGVYANVANMRDWIRDNCGL